MSNYGPFYSVFIIYTIGLVFTFVLTCKQQFNNLVSLDLIFRVASYFISCINDLQTKYDRQ